MALVWVGNVKKQFLFPLHKVRILFTCFGGFSTASFIVSSPWLATLETRVG